MIKLKCKPKANQKNTTILFQKENKAVANNSCCLVS